MKNSSPLAVALILGLAGCAAATAPHEQTRTGFVAYRHQQDTQ